MIFMRYLRVAGANVIRFCLNLELFRVEHLQGVIYQVITTVWSDSGTKTLY